MKKICILNTTCNSSTYNSLINSIKNKYELTSKISEADYIIYPMCVSTDKVIYQEHLEVDVISSIKKDNAKLILTGCVTKLDKDHKNIIDDLNVDYIVPKNDIKKICEILDIEDNKDMYNKYDVISTVSIGDGCANRCSFCRIHYSDRILIDRSIDDIANEIRSLVSKGVRIINLESLNTAQYGINLYNKKNLHTLINEISKIDDLEGIIVTAVSLSDVYDDLIFEFKNNDKVLMVRTDIQSGSDRMLKIMNVGHTKQDIIDYYKELKDKIRSTRIISSHPYEEVNDVNETIEVLYKLNLVNLTVQPFIKSIDTPSGKMPDLDKNTFNKHLKLYNEAKDNIIKNYYKNNEGEKIKGIIFALNKGYASVFCKNNDYLYVYLYDLDINVNLGDEVMIEIINGLPIITSVIKSSNIVLPKVDENNLYSYISNIFDVRDDYRLSIFKIEDKLYTIYENIVNSVDNENDIIKEINTTPNALRKALIKIHEERKEEK